MGHSFPSFSSRIFHGFGGCCRFTHVYRPTLYHIYDLFVRKWEEEGYREGLTSGRSHGLNEGFALGYEEGSKIGSNLGNISGLFLGLLNKPETPEAVKRRIEKTLQEIIDFPLTNDEDDMKETKLNRIDAAFREVSSIMGLGPNRSQNPSPSSLEAMKKKLEF